MTLVRHWRIVVLASVAAAFVGWLIYQNTRPVSDYHYDVAKKRDTADAWRSYRELSGNTARARGEIARLHDAARARMRAAGVPHGEGLDPILAALLESADHRIKLVAPRLVVDRPSFQQVMPQLSTPEAKLEPIDVELEKMGAHPCASGLSAAFGELTGSDVLTIAQDAPDDALRLTLAWSARATGAAYANRRGRRMFPGFEVTSRLELTIPSKIALELEATLAPGRDVAYTTTALGAGLGVDINDVAYGMLAAVCQRLGEQLIERMTGRPPPVPAAPDAEQLARDCEDSVAGACLAIGTRARERNEGDRGLAHFEKGCRASGIEAGEACVAGAELVLEQPVVGDMAAMDRRAKASVMLDRACRAHHAPACARHAELELVPHGDEGAPSAYASRRALLWLLRACDLGHAAGCLRAGRLYAEGRGLDPPTASPARAAALGDRACRSGSDDACTDAKAWRRAAARETTVAGVVLRKGDEVFDVRFGSWFEHEESDVVWIASRQDRKTVTERMDAGSRARVYEPSALPPGPRPPAWTRAVYAVIPALPSRDAKPCPDCYEGAAHNPFQSMGCTCLPPAR